MISNTNLERATTYFHLIDTLIDTLRYEFKSSDDWESFQLSLQKPYSNDLSFEQGILGFSCPQGTRAKATDILKCAALVRESILGHEFELLESMFDKDALRYADAVSDDPFDMSCEGRSSFYREHIVFLKKAFHENSDKLPF